MTEQEMRIAIAEACGWEFIVSHDCQGKAVPDRWVKDGMEYFTDYPFPDYPNNLNAMHEAEQKLLDTPNAWPRYLDELSSIQPAPLTVRAKAKQRAEAFLKTIGKWKD